MSDPLKIQTFTIGYSDSEDRVWVRVILVDHTEARLWLTRRLVQRVVETTADLLIKTLPKETDLSIPGLGNAISMAKLAADFAKAKENPSDAPAPPPPETRMAASLPVGLCQSLDITPAEKVWSFIWRTPGSPGYLLMIDRCAVMRLTAGLLTQAQTAGWNLPEAIEKKLLGPAVEQ